MENLETQVIIKLNSIHKIYSFNNAAKVFTTEIDLSSKNNPRHRVDAKSIMGIFTLDLSAELIVTLTNGIEETEKDRFILAIAQFSI